MQQLKTSELTVENRKIGIPYPTYFIADIAANHNGSLETAKELIHLAAVSGADAAKFQHFRAEKIVSAYGFENMTSLSHQAKWSKPVFEVYREASVPWEWTEELVKTCKQEGIHFFSAPYDLEAIDMLDPWMPAYKIGSGDINWLESIEKMASKKKPVFLATGASTLEEVRQAAAVIQKHVSEICIMQCNTNYTGSPENFKHINLNALQTLSREFPDAVLGLSDHTLGCATVLGAVALGARAVEKHFTSSRSQKGPDHQFSVVPAEWREMVDRTRELEAALGCYEKKVADNEKETVLIQRRCCRASRALEAGAILRREDIDVLRPAVAKGVSAANIQQLIGRKLKRNLVYGEEILLEDTNV